MQLASFSLGDNLNKLVHSQGHVPFARRSYSHYADGKQLKHVWKSLPLEGIQWYLLASYKSATFKYHLNYFGWFVYF